MCNIFKCMEPFEIFCIFAATLIIIICVVWRIYFTEERFSPIDTEPEDDEYEFNYDSSSESQSDSSSYSQVSDDPLYAAEDFDESIDDRI